jgi:hypothetical protein
VFQLSFKVSYRFILNTVQDFVGSYANPSEFVMGRSARVSVASSSQPIPKELNFQQMDTAKISPPLEINHTGFNKEEVSCSFLVCF